MATVRKVGNKTLKLICDCKRKHTITATGEGDDIELELETFLPNVNAPAGSETPAKKKTNLFDFLADD